MVSDHAIIIDWMMGRIVAWTTLGSNQEDGFENWSGGEVRDFVQALTACLAICRF